MRIASLEQKVAQLEREKTALEAALSTSHAEAKTVLEAARQETNASKVKVTEARRQAEAKRK